MVSDLVTANLKHVNSSNERESNTEKIKSVVKESPRVIVSVGVIPSFDANASVRSIVSDCVKIILDAPESSTNIESATEKISFVEKGGDP